MNKAMKKTIDEAQAEIDRIETEMAKLEVTDDDYVKYQDLKAKAINQLNDLKQDQPKHKHPLDIFTGIAGVVISAVGVGAEIGGHIIRSDGAKTAFKNSINSLTKFIK